MIIFSIIMFSCGSYQYSGNISDGIYGDNRNVAYQEETVQNDIYDDKVKNTYYQTVFNEKAMEYEEAKSLNDSVFTDIDNYQSVVENDTINNSSAPWGEDINQLTINLYRGPAYSSIRWSRLWNYPIWLNNYGYGYGSVWNTWGYGYNNFWLRPHIYPYWGYYNDFYSPFWMGMGWGYNYYFNPFYYGHHHHYNNYGYFQNQWIWNNSSIAYISGGRGSRNTTSSRSGYANSSSRSDYVNTSSRIGNRINNPSSATLRDRISRVDRINNAARVKPSYYTRPVSNYKPTEMPPSKPSSNYNYKPSSSSSSSSSNYNYKPSSNYNSGNSGSYKPSSNYSSGSSGSFSSPSFKPSSSSRPSSSSSGSRGGRSGGR